MAEEIQAERLTRARQKVGLTKYKLARMSGVNRSLIIQAESGKLPLSYKTAKQLAPHLNFSVAYLRSFWQVDNQNGMLYHLFQGQNVRGRLTTS
jgi:transcriptional regulator with XRE-family HTH domain